MKTPHLQATLHVNRSAITNEFYEQMIKRIFEKNDADMDVEVRSWT